MSGPTLTDLDQSTRTAALGQLRQALSMIIHDPYATSLLRSASAGSGTTTPLGDWLYAHWWCGPGLHADPLPASDPARQTEAERGACRLEATRRTAAPRSAGWLVLAAVGDVLVTAHLGPGPDHAPEFQITTERRIRTERRITTTPDAVVASSRPGLPPRPGDLVTVRLGTSGLDPAHAWWWAHAGRPEDLTGIALDRWYVHARDLAAATRLVPLLLAAVAEADCPVTLKCPPTEAGYGRRDALVVYLPRELCARAEKSLRRRAALIEPLVRRDVPPLTRPLLPGVARAEDPGHNADRPGADEQPISYGQLRCGQVATLAQTLLADPSGCPQSDRVDDDALIGAGAAVGIDVDAIDRVG